MSQENPPRIVLTLRWICKLIAVLLSINFLIFLYSLYLILPTWSAVSFSYIILASGLVLIGFSTALVSLWLAFARSL
jgi:hypothetical protein